MTNLTILGSTGSIGVQALEVAERHPDRFGIRGLGAWGNVELLREQIARFRPGIVAASPRAAAELRRNPGGGLEVLEGESGIRELARDPEADAVLNAVAGNGGLGATWDALRLGKRLLLANKESLVMAGELVMAMAAETGAALLPIDSEHAALYQALEGRDRATVSRTVITASGGPFWGREPEPGAVTPDMVLDHPVWSMGPKVTVDSATMMNKGLERIEARWLFNLEPDRVRAVIHPNPLVHAMVEFTDGNILAHLSVPDMRIPIAWAMFHPARAPTPAAAGPALPSCPPLEFFEIPPGRFPCYELADAAMKSGGAAPLILSVADEAAVEAFLDRRLPFEGIPAIIAAMLDIMGGEPLPGDMESIIALAAETGARTRERIRAADGNQRFHDAD